VCDCVVVRGVRVRLSRVAMSIGRAITVELEIEDRRLVNVTDETTGRVRSPLSPTPLPPFLPRQRCIRRPAADPCVCVCVCASSASQDMIRNLAMSIGVSDPRPYGVFIEHVSNSKLSTWLNPYRPVSESEAFMLRFRAGESSTSWKYRFRMRFAPQAPMDLQSTDTKSHTYFFEQVRHLPLQSFSAVSRGSCSHCNQLVNQIARNEFPSLPPETAIRLGCFAIQKRCIDMAWKKFDFDKFEYVAR
jgi:hypothetical protein